MMSVQDKNDVSSEESVIVKTQMTLDHNMPLDTPLPLLRYIHYEFLKLHYIRYKVARVSSQTCNSHINYVILLQFQIILCKNQVIPIFLFIDILIVLKAFS